MKKILLLFCIFILVSQAFSQFTIYNTSNSGLNDNDCWFVNQNAAGDVWVGTYGGGANKYNGTTWTNYTTINSGVSSNSITPVQFKSNVTWMGTAANGISVYNGSVWTVYNTSVSSICGNEIMSIAYDAVGNTWIATRYNGICKFDGVNWTTFNSTNSGLISNQVYQVEVDPSGNIWVGYVVNGISRFDGVSNWTHYNTSNSSLPDNSVYSLNYNTATNSLWIGTNGGLATLTGTVWAVHTTTNSNFPSNYVRGITHSYTTGNTWIATGNGGIGRWNGFSWTTYNTSNSNLPSNLVWSIKAGASSKIWASLFGAGVVSMSDILSGVNETNINNLQFNLYPNPSSGSAQIKITSQNGGTARFLIYDNLGKEIIEQNIEIIPDKSENMYAIDISTLSSGFYSCSLEFNNSSINRKLVVQN